MSQELNYKKLQVSIDRSIEKSNNKNPHRAVMISTAFKDWQGRLALLKLQFP